MAILKRRQCDVFVSYAHVDDLPDREGEKGWVHHFANQLSVRLLKRFGEKVEVWRDPQLARAQRYDPVIERAVHGAGVMVCLLSNRYLKSEYCSQEIAWFQAKAAAEPEGLVVGDFLRIFPVLLYNIPSGQWPEVCKGTSGFSFFDAQGEAFGMPLAPGSEAFNRQLYALVEELYLVLTQLRGLESAALGAAAAEAAEPPFTVFLSQPADDLRPTARQLSAALVGQGIEVLTGVPPPYDEGGHAATVREAMAKADLAVHLLSFHPGEPLDEADSARTYPLEQARLGLEHARSQLVLMPDELVIELIDQPAYAEFLRSLGDRKRDAEQFELVRAGRQRMLDEILAKRQRLEESARRRAQAATGSPGIAFIDLHSHDVPRATELVGYLVERQITPVMIPAADLSPTAGMSLFEENLKRAKLFVVVFGSVARAWVEHRLQEAFKLILNHQLDTRIGVYVAPPEKPPDQVKFPGLFEVAVNMVRFDPGTLQPLLAKVGVVP
jgi:TIR domain